MTVFPLIALTLSALSTFASGLPEWAGMNLMLIVMIAIIIPSGYTYNYAHMRQLANNMRTLRVSPTCIEYFGRGQEILGCDRASLRVRRLRYVPRVWADVDAPPDAMAIEFSGPGLVRSSSINSTCIASRCGSKSTKSPDLV